MLLYAPALNYVYPYYLKHMSNMSEEAKQRIESGDPHFIAMQSMGSAMLKKDFANDSRKYEVNLSKPVNIKCPVRILHGLKDTEVASQQSLDLCQSIVSDDVDIIFRKNGPHQLEQPIDIEIFLNILDRMLKDHPVRT